MGHPHFSNPYCHSLKPVCCDPGIYTTHLLSLTCTPPKPEPFHPQISTSTGSKMVDSPILNGFLGGSGGKETACNAGDPGTIPESGRSPGERNGNLLQYSCLENPMDRGAWQAMIHRATNSQTQLSTHSHQRWANKANQSRD